MILSKQEIFSRIWLNVNFWWCSLCKGKYIWKFLPYMFPQLKTAIVYFPFTKILQLTTNKLFLWQDCGSQPRISSAVYLSFFLQCKICRIDVFSKLSFAIKTEKKCGNDEEDRPHFLYWQQLLKRNNLSWTPKTHKRNLNPSTEKIKDANKNFSPTLCNLLF